MPRRSGASSLRGDACYAAGAEQAHALTGGELLIGFLHDRAHLAAIEAYRDFECVLARRLVLERVPCNAASNAGEHGGDARSGAMTDLAAGDAANRASGGRANARLAALQRHLAYGVDGGHAHGLLAARLVLAVHVARFMRNATSERGCQRDGQ